MGHDSSGFYGRRLYNGKGTESNRSISENRIPEKLLNRVYCRSSEKMDELPDCSVHLVVTSPPYNVGKEYDDDLTIKEYVAFLSRVFSECHRVLVNGGRICVNTANVGRRPYVPLNSLIARLMIRIGYLMRGEIIWNKGASAGASCAWGSWKSPSNPVLRDVHEYILVFSKASFGRSERKTATIDRDSFLEWTRSIWDFPAESAHKVGHPAPFPVELPLRLINLYTYKNDIVLDPFIGSGSTAVACGRASRFWVGYDTSEEYCDLTRKRAEVAVE